MERDLGIEFAPHQAEAISKCFSVPALLLTGGPGTGKTTAIAGILAIADARGWRTMLCAPTGRAAKRLSELSGHEARTIHRLLEFDPATWSFMRDDDNPIEADLVIVDEMSMVDIELMAALIRAVPLSAHLVLVGDPDQLPSVGPGNVLRDLLDSGCLESVALRQVFRQDETGSIVTNAHRVRNGEMPVFRRETVFIEAGSPESIVEHVREHARMQDSQVIAPMHNTLPGVRNLNAVLQRDLNGSGKVIFNKGDTVWRKGDKVMQTRNNYDKDVFNGDIGTILDGTTEDAELTIDFDGRTVRYSFDDMEDVVHAYAITVHKSQGSEYECVIMPLSLQHRIMLQRNLLYTAMTRARCKLVFIGQKQALALAVNNNRTAARRSYLCRRLTEAMR
jgi:exodeoxyribonuclease V alpha subunit